MSIYQDYLPFKKLELPIIIGDDFKYIQHSNESLFESLSNTLELLYNKITFIGDITNKFSTIDKIYNDQLNNAYQNFYAIWMSMTNAERRVANENFIYSESDKSPLLPKLLNIIKTFPIIAKDTWMIADSCLRTTSVTDIPTISDLFNNANLSQYKITGIAVDDPYITFDNPFSKVEQDTSLKDLGFVNLEDIITIEKEYKFQVNTSLNNLLRIKDRLLRMYAQLKQETTSSQNQNDVSSIKLHFQAVLFTSNVVCNMVSKLLMLNRVIMYKRKLLLDFAYKAASIAIKGRD